MKLNSKGLLFFVSCAMFNVALPIGGFSASVPVIQRVFGLTSVQISMIDATNDLVGIVTSVAAAYVATLFRKGTILGFSGVMGAVSSILFALPHFLNNHSTGLLGSTNPVEFCSENATNGTHFTNPGFAGYSYFFYIAQVCLAVALGGFDVTAIAYIDENVLQESSPSYLMIVLASRVVGQAIGYVIGGLAQLLIIDDVPAWWLAQLIPAVLQVISAVPLFFCPDELKSKKKYRAQDKNQAHAGKNEGPNVTKSISDFKFAIKLIFTNPAFTFVTLSNVCHLFLIGGMLSYFPLVFIHMFHFSNSTAGILGGVIFLIPAISGGGFGAWAIKKFHLTVRSLLRILVLICFICSLGGLLFLIRCPNYNLVGFDRTYGSHESPIASTAFEIACNEGCECESKDFHPVCLGGDDLVTFYSPCFAGELCFSGFF